MLNILLLLLSLFSIPSSANETVMEVLPLFNRSAIELQAIITPLLDNSEQIIANRSNLIIKATPARQEEIRKLLKQLDTRLNNLSITVLQSRTKTAQKLNASANIRLGIVSNQPSNVSGKISGRFAQTEGFKHSDSTQIINTLEGKTAYIQTGKIFPVQLTDIYESGSGYPVISSNTQYIEATTGFLVTPRLTGKQVTLEIEPWSDKINSRNSTVETQSGHTTIRVDLGVWVEIGSINEHSRISNNGTLSHAYSTANKNMHILVKVEKTN